MDFQKELVTALEAAQILGIGTRTLWRRDASGGLPQAVRIGRCKRWRRAELMDWIKEGCPPRHRWVWRG